MEENLVGYLLNALEPDEHRQVEHYLQAVPGAAQELRTLRRALEPLKAAHTTFDSPPGLATRTLARISGLRSRDLPRAPEPVVRMASPGRGHWWRRADVLVAASLLFILTLLVPPGISYLRFRHDKAACADNLRVLGQALDAYARMHGDRLPNVADPFGDSGPVPVQQVSRRAAAGMFVPMLADAGVLTQTQVSVTCAANGPARSPAGWTLDQLRDMSDCAFGASAASLAPCYAYTLGYVEGGEIYGACLGGGLMPVLSDRPPPGGPCAAGNSLNHGGRGQNVLFAEGNVLFLRGRTYQDDDIYTNRAHEVHAGKFRGDYVLGPSGSQP